MNEEIKVEQPTLIHFIEKIVELAKQGYVPSKTNQGAPQSWGLGLFTCGMVLESSETGSNATPKQEVDEPKEKVETSQEAPQEPESNVSETPQETVETESNVSESTPKKTTTRRRKSTSK